MSLINQSTYQSLIQQMEYECAEGEGKNKISLKRFWHESHKQRKFGILDYEVVTKQSVLKTQNKV